MFQLVKWYLDVVTDDGAVVLLYQARLRWAGLRLRYAAILLDECRRRRVERATTHAVTVPCLDQDGVRWHNERLGVVGRWRSDAPSICRTLASGANGAIDWTCHVPRGRATVSCDGVTYRGTGYVECLTLGVPPWRLPFRALQWGRHASRAHSLIWIDWDGRDPRCWVWLDGEECAGAGVADSCLTGLAHDTTMRMDDARDLRNRRVLAALAGVLPAAARRAAGPLAAMHEHKRVARSALMRTGQPIDTGWTVYEQVTW